MKMNRSRKRLHHRVIVPDSDFALLGIDKLRRVSDEILNDDTRRFFIPRGVPIKINMNYVVSLLLRGIADGAARKLRGLDNGRRF